MLDIRGYSTFPCCWLNVNVTRQVSNFVGSAPWFTLYVLFFQSTIFDGLKSQCLLLAQFWFLKIPIKALNPLFPVYIYIWSPCNPSVVAENPNHPILDKFSIRTHGDLGYNAILAPTAAPTAVSRRSCEPPWAFPASSWSPWHFLNGGDSGDPGGCKVILFIHKWWVSSFFGGWLIILTLLLSRTGPQALINHS